MCGYCTTCEYRHYRKFKRSPPRKIHVHGNPKEGITDSWVGFFASGDAKFGVPKFPKPQYYHPLSRAGLEKSSVLPVLDRFLSLETDFVLNRKQKNRSIKVLFFSSNSQ